MVGRWYQGERDQSHQCDSPLPPEQNAASTQLMKSSCSDSPRVVADQKNTQGSGQKKGYLHPTFPFRTTGSLWPITIVIIKSSPLQVQDIKVDNVSIIF